MPQYLVLEQAGPELRGNVRTGYLSARNIKDAITQAKGVDDHGHIQVATSTTQLLVVRVAEIVAIDVHHHLPTVATLDELRPVYEGNENE